MPSVGLDCGVGVLTFWNPLDNPPPSTPPPMPRSPWERVTPNCNIKPGDIVRLVGSQGPVMTVTGLNDQYRPMHHCVGVKVCWFDTLHHIQTAEFNDALLERKVR